MACAFACVSAIARCFSTMETLLKIHSAKLSTHAGRLAFASGKQFTQWLETITLGGRWVDAFNLIKLNMNITLSKQTLNLVCCHCKCCPFYRMSAPNRNCVIDATNDRTLCCNMWRDQLDSKSKMYGMHVIIVIAAIRTMCCCGGLRVWCCIQVARRRGGVVSKVISPQLGHATRQIIYTKLK